MLKCKSLAAYVILLGALLSISMTTAWAEFDLSNASPQLLDPPSVSDINVSNFIELNNSTVINKEAIQATMIKIPLNFMENRGQSSDEVKFMFKTSRQTVFLTPWEVVFSLSSGNNSSVVHMAFEGSEPGQITGEDSLPGTANFFIGNNSSEWMADIPTYGAIRYKDLYPGVDLVFKGTEGHLKHELILSPGADPAQIVLVYSGQDNLSLAEDGSVLIRTSAGNITDSAPVCYQEIDGRMIMVEGRYRIIDEKRIGFDIGNYDRGYQLVIDPELVYSTYLGGSITEMIGGIAIDGNGNAYVTGFTDSANFPTQNPYQSIYASGYDDAFITKLDPARNTLVYSTYLGGSRHDAALSIAVDGGGNAYVTGSTVSTNFPTQNPYQGTYAGGSDAFVAKLSPGGNALVYSTYLGGSTGQDQAQGIAVDGSGNAYVTGNTYSINFPTQNPYQDTFAGIWDAFVAKLSPAGTSLVYSTYLGGSGDDGVEGITVDNSGNAYVTGITDSADFPTQNPYQGTFSGISDAFVTKLSPGGNALVYSTFLGGNSYAIGFRIAVGSSGNAYVAGETDSTDFPTQNPYQSTFAGISDAFVTKLSPSGNALVYSTYLGGSSHDSAYSIAVDGSGSAYVTGRTNSTNFPTQNPYQGTNSGSEDAFVTRLSPGGNALVYSTYLGGSSGEEAYGIAIDGSGNAYVTGFTVSANFPTRDPLQASNAGITDIFVAVLSSYINFCPDFTDTVDTGSWRSWSVMQNPTEAIANATISIKSRSGNMLFNGNISIPPYGVSVIRPRNLVGADCSGSVVVTSDQPIMGTCEITRNSNEMCMEYNAADHSSTTLYYPDFTDTADANSWRSWFVLQNPGSTQANLSLEIRSRAGDVLYSGSLTIPSNAVSAIRPRDLAGADCAGSAIITSDQPITGTCQITRNSNKMCMSYNALDHGATTLYYPDFTDTANSDSWRSWLVLQNPSASPANLSYEIRSRAGDVLYTGSDVIPPHSVNAIRPRNLVGADCPGSAVVTSDQPIMGTCQITRNSNEMCMSYNALDQGSTTLFYPDFTDTADANSWRSWLVLQNPTASAANITLQIRSRAGDLLYSGSQVIPAHGVSAIRPRNLVGSDCAGSVVVTSGQPIIGTCQINRNNNLMCMSYSAFG